MKSAVSLGDQASCAARPLFIPLIEISSDGVGLRGCPKHGRTPADGAENHQPLPRVTAQILQESLDISPPFFRYYRSRVALRLGDASIEVAELDKRKRGGGDEWMPTFS